MQLSIAGAVFAASALILLAVCLFLGQWIIVLRRGERDIREHHERASKRLRETQKEALKELNRKDVQLRRAHEDELQRRKEDADARFGGERSRCEQQIAQRDAQVDTLIKSQRRLAEHLRILLEKLNLVDRYCEQDALENWFAQIRTASMDNRIEIGQKLIYPMLACFLGYSNDRIEIEVPTDVRIYGDTVHATVEWLIHLDEPNGNRRNMFTINTLIPGMADDDDLISRFRSLAYATDSEKYVVTDGIQFRIYHTTVRRSEPELSCRVVDIETNWPRIREELVPSAF